MKILTVLGARPQFIKSHPVSICLHGVFDEVLVHTGQHYDEVMSGIFFKEMGIKEPLYNLGVGSGSHGVQTARIIEALETVIISEKPDAILIYGDTNSTLAGAIVASKLYIPIIHIEAGLRSYAKMPEEINRVLADRVSNFLFCPTKQAQINLEKEGITKGVHLVGDVMYDAALYFKEISQKKVDIVRDFGVKKGDYNLVTIHRAENTECFDVISNLLKALSQTGEKFLFPIHPRTRKFLVNNGFDFNKLKESIRFIEPVGYLEMLSLEMNAQKILTDSGGIQKEAYFFGIPCITLRNETEWVETVECGWNLLAGSNPEKVLRAIENFSPPTFRENFYGDGIASKKLVDVLKRELAIIGKGI